jgi:excisionase family DNA binding protein
MSDRAITPPRLAEQLGVNVHRVLGWIARGELAAVNVGDGVRPRYRILPQAVEAFLAARSAKPAPKARRRQKEKRASGFVNYF